MLDRILPASAKLRFATKAEDALRLVREFTPDLVLLDAEMPGMSGFQVFAALKAQPEMVDVPVILVTSRSDADFEIAGFEMGAAEFIVKPVNARFMLAPIKTQLRGVAAADRSGSLQAVQLSIWPRPGR